jgi:hypothetical protein
MRRLFVAAIAGRTLLPVWGDLTGRPARPRGPPPDAGWIRLHRFSEGNGTMKRLSVLLLVTLAALLAAPSAQAAQPTVERFPVNNQGIDDETCGFPVETTIIGSVVAIRFEEGRVLYIEADPQLKMTLTNLDTGETITANISGPTHVFATADEGITELQTGLWARFENPETGEQGLFQSAGLLRITVDAEGDIESVQFVGRVTDLDVCAQLAA